MENFINPEVFKELGPGVIAIALLFWGIVYYVRKIGPSLEKVSSTNQEICSFMKVLDKTLENNTQAISEVSRANDNVAGAIKLLETTMKNVQEKVEKIDTMHIDIAKMEERTRGCNFMAHKEGMK